MLFFDKLRAAQATTGAALCVGLDPDPARLPAPLADLPAHEAVVRFNRAIVEATADIACAYKPNLAFYEALGTDGWRALEATLEAIPENRLTIADGKRGDIGNTAKRYAAAFFDTLGVDAVTVTPYMGRDAIRPFLDAAHGCAFVLVATSNPSGADLQDIVFESRPVHAHVADLAVETAADAPGSVGFVVGATRPEILTALRWAHPNVPFLVPGVGAQGGSAEAVLDANAGGPLLVNSSRGILYASSGDDFAEAARTAAQALAATLPV
ncbi:MAG: orotidine-5'-phosphate decarboxylase [Bacteroidota bacterium]